jgi:hypothetical protein
VNLGGSSSSASHFRVAIFNLTVVSRSLIILSAS